MSLGQFISILRARWLAALAVLVVAVLGTLVVSLMLPKQYKAVASVLVDFKPDPLSAVMFGGLASPAFMATQVDIIQSDRVAQRVVRDLKLNENPQVRRQWQDETQGQGSIESWLGAVFQRQMEVVPSRESSVISVSYRAPDPRFAAAVANAFVQAYLATTVELRVDPARQYSTFFDSRTKDARETLEKAQARVSAYQRQNGIIATDERLDVENARLNELSSQLVALQALSADSTSRQLQAAGGAGERMAEVLNNAVVGSLKADLSRAEGRLQELNSRYGVNHPQVVEAKASIGDLRSRLDAEVRRVTSGVGVSNTINRQREAETRAALEAQRAKMLRMKAIRDEAAVLVRDVESAQRAYDQLQARLTQTSLESQTTQSNVVVLTEAFAPLAPSSPRTLLNTLVALVVGAVLAVFVALLLEVLDRRIRSLEGLVAALGLPLIGVIPKPNARRLFQPAGTSAMQRRLVHQPTLKRVGA